MTERKPVFLTSGSIEAADEFVRQLILFSTGEDVELFLSDDFKMKDFESIGRILHAIEEHGNVTTVAMNSLKDEFILVFLAGKIKRMKENTSLILSREFINSDSLLWTLLLKAIEECVETMLRPSEGQSVIERLSNGKAISFTTREAEIICLSNQTLKDSESDFLSRELGEDLVNFFGEPIKPPPTIRDIESVDGWIAQREAYRNLSPMAKRTMEFTRITRVRLQN